MIGRSPRNGVSAARGRCQLPCRSIRVARRVRLVDAHALLRLEAQTIWGWERGRLSSDTVVATLMTYDGRFEILPGAVTLAESTTVQVSVCRCWLLTATSPQRVPSGLDLHHRLGVLAPPARWSDEDWHDLMRGVHGPWVALAAGQQVVSLAHCARLTNTAAEVGVQTEKDLLGRGLAGVVVSAWAELMDGPHTLLYSAVEDNTASHRVADKLGAVPLGRIARTFVAPTD